MPLVKSAQSDFQAKHNVSTGANLAPHGCISFLLPFLISKELWTWCRHSYADLNATLSGLFIRIVEISFGILSKLVFFIFSVGKLAVAPPKIKSPPSTGVPPLKFGGKGCPPSHPIFINPNAPPSCRGGFQLWTVGQFALKF